MGRLLYASHNNILFIKLVGHITFKVSTDFNKFIDRSFAEGDFGSVLIDLTETTAIDSTSLGLLAKISKLMLNQLQKRTTIVSTREEINEIINGLGFNKIFIILDRPDAVPGDFSEVAWVPETDKEMAKTMLAAHRELVELNEVNERVFRNVLEFLEREINS